MKTIIKTLVLICLFGAELHAQFDLMYKVCDTCQATSFLEDKVSEDFGRRPTGSRWHKGLDYSPAVGDGDVGYQLLALQDGTITQLDVTGYKYIIVQSGAEGTQPAIIWGFGHIFTDLSNEIGNFEVAQLLAPNNDESAIVYKNDSGDVLDVFGNVAGTIEYNDTTYVVTNQITTGQPLAPLGSSGGFATMAHLHLYNFTIPDHPNPGGDLALYNSGDHFHDFKDPLEYLDYDTAIYNITINTDDVTYAVNDYASIRVRCELSNDTETLVNRHNVPMDVDDVELFIKKNNEPETNYALIKGVWLESKISNGARFVNGNTTRYPSPNNPPHNTPPTAGSQFPFGGVDIAHPDDNNGCGGLGIGCKDRTGYASRCYNTANYDDYYFSDIKLRVHKTDSFFANKTVDSIKYAVIGDDARYPDAWYHLRAKVTTVKNSEYYSDEVVPPLIPQLDSILIDNFRPYIDSINIYSLTTLYAAGWQWDAADTTLQLMPNDIPGNNILADANGFEDVVITLWCSEPMQSTNILLNDVVGSSNAPIPDATRMVWTIVFNSSDLSGLLGTQRLHITGTDLAGNQLLGFADQSDPDPDLENNYTSGQLPHRTGSGANDWSVAFAGTTDSIHLFNIDPCAGSEGPQLRTNGRRRHPLRRSPFRFAAAL